MSTVVAPATGSRETPTNPVARGVVTVAVSVPFQADRFARPGERCTCGRPALVAYTRTKYAPFGFCGLRAHR
jgi:hypothetical protein